MNRRIMQLIQKRQIINVISAESTNPVIDTTVAAKN